MAAQPVDVLYKSHIHLQSPLPGGFLCMSDIDAGTPGAGQFPGKTLLEPYLTPVFQGFGGGPDCSS